MVEVPTKIWIPKQENKYIGAGYSDDIGDEIFNLKGVWE